MIAIPTPATPLATLLASAVRPPKLAEYRGALTPQELDAPATETAALAEGVAVHDLGWMRRVAVRGEDRFRWLSGMVTNTVNDLDPNTGAWNLVLNAQGRIQGDLTVWREGHESLQHAPEANAADPSLNLEIAADQYERLLAHLEHFIIMDDVELVPLGLEPGAEETALGLTGPQADEVLERMGLPTLSEPMTCTRVEWNGMDLRIFRGYGALAPHYELWTPVAGVLRLWRTFSTAGAVLVGSAALEAFRIAEGIPVFGIDMLERDLPQETSQMRALHFNKGCYLGQEIVERIRSRGSVHRHLRQLELEGPVPEPGAELMFDGAAAGKITSAAELQLAAGSRVFALGMMRGETEARNEALTYTAGAAAGTARLLSSPPNL
ncbi:MAG: folate-binding protein YgfZ [Acidobacteriota bacterium]|nr:folate-binding protein YgfZ [Acidobacteriota bacterium]